MVVVFDSAAFFRAFLVFGQFRVFSLRLCLFSRSLYFWLSGAVPLFFFLFVLTSTQTLFSALWSARILISALRSTRNFGSGFWSVFVCFSARQYS